MKHLVLIATVWLSLITLSSCCNEEDVNHRLPSHVGMYYEDNDTIVFYSEETDEYETYVVCDRRERMYGEEINGTWCSWVEYYHGMNYTLSRDSCDSPRYFSIGYERLSLGSTSHIYSYYQEDSYDASFSLYDSDHKKSEEILGDIYYEVADGKIHIGDSLKSFLFSKEYGIIQYSFEHKTFSLLRNEKK